MTPDTRAVPPAPPTAKSYVLWAVIGGVLGWSVGEGQAKPFALTMGSGFVMAFRLTGAFMGVIALPFARLMAYRLGIERSDFKKIGYVKLALVALICMALGAQLGLALGAGMGAGFASMTPSMALAFAGLVVPVLTWARRKANARQRANSSAV